MRAIPGLPGAAKSWTPGDWASFQQRACSRPPEPITRIFIWAGYNGSNAGQL